MERAPGGSPVGVDDPYAHVRRCDHVTDEGKCRWAVEQRHRDPEFADARSVEEFRCPAADPDGDWAWADCPHFRSTTAGTECIRCGLEERRLAHEDVRPLLEEHHLSYADGSARGKRQLDHEITVSLCRWCHAKVHNSWARIDDDASPDPDAVAEAETRKGRELDELSFESASERFGDRD
ncbi:DUF7097 family protein [Halapricum desulfuricans]|uniref:Uncharacterized protein n=1 Tax=Halapricum desulfuricans TaxID=2841257 RepID=A0A897MR42_9EURY|nr:hypothetical protein [Halapricum desulfuricans]QSG04620.1 Uncharacterized protein HSR121_0262 [Halapricum desulfuricans]